MTEAAEVAASDPTVNLEELAELLEISLPTARKMVREDGFPVKQRGAHGVPYEFDVREVKAWKADNEKRLDEERARRETELAQLKLELFGGTTIDPGRVHLSPREQAAALQAEVNATQLARLRGELVSAAELEDALGTVFTILRRGLLEVGNQVGRRFSLDREVQAGITESIRQELTRAHDTMLAMAKSEQAGGSGA